MADWDPPKAIEVTTKRGDVIKDGEVVITYRKRLPNTNTTKDMIDRALDMLSQDNIPIDAAIKIEVTDWTTYVNASWRAARV